MQDEMSQLGWTVWLKHVNWEVWSKDHVSWEVMDLLNWNEEVSLGAHVNWY